MGIKNIQGDLNIAGNLMRNNENILNTIKIDVDENSTLQDIVNVLSDSGRDYTRPNMISLSTGNSLIVRFSSYSSGTYFVLNLKTGLSTESGGMFSQIKVQSLINKKIGYYNSEGEYIESNHSSIEDAVTSLLSDMGDISTVLDNVIAQTNTIIGGTE